MEKDISNSKRHAVFPWQPGFHGNGPAKDAISVKKYLLTLRCTVCTQIQGHIRPSAHASREDEDEDKHTHTQCVLSAHTPEVSFNYRPLMFRAQLMVCPLWGVKEVSLILSAVLVVFVVTSLLR